MALTKYQRLRKAKASYCKGKSKMTSVTKAKNAYIKDAVKKGKSKTEATKIANKVVKGSCKLKAKRTKKRKTTRRRRRA